MVTIQLAVGSKYCLLLIWTAESCGSQNFPSAETIYRRVIPWSLYGKVNCWPSLDSTHTWDSELSLNLRSLIDSNFAERTVWDRLLTRGLLPNLGFLYGTPWWIRVRPKRIMVYGVNGPWRIFFFFFFPMASMGCVALLK